MADVSGFDPVSAARLLATAVCYRYHDSTKHTVDKLLSGEHYLDWKNQPNPFRNYKGADVIELARSITCDQSVRYFDIVPYQRRTAEHEYLADAQLISNLLFYSTAISAWKQVRNTDNRWALRVNASSGNLHPTETHLAIDRVSGLEPGIYHYKVDDHSLELRARGDHARRAWVLAGNEVESCPPVVACFTSIFWRECWKYRQRGFRYCQHDMGHALGSLMVAANSFAWQIEPFAIFADEEVARLFGVRDTDEAPALIVGLRSGSGSPNTEAVARGSRGSVSSADTESGTDTGYGVNTGYGTASSTDTTFGTNTVRSIETACGTDIADSASSSPEMFEGTPNQLSAEVIGYEIVDLVQSACVLSSDQVTDIRKKLKADLHTRSLFVDARPATLMACDQEDVSARLDSNYARQKGADEPAHKTIRRRRSAVDMDGKRRMSLADLAVILSTSTRGFNADFSRCLSLAPAQTNEDCGAYLVDLFIYVHRVDDLQSGLYFFDRPRQELVPLAMADQRQNAKFASCFQDIAADGCFSISMVADLARAYYLFGDRGYKLVHYEAGVIGQLLYLASTALGYDATGIGCFIDDAINKYLVLPDGTEVIYNFTIGGAVLDARLTTLPSYDFAQ